jgi:Type I phosphodiesterase / nucleotide pyrophosphatase
MLKYVALGVAMMAAGLAIYSDFNTKPAIEHVIYITLDGTRWQDVLQNSKNFPKLWQNRAENITVYGMPGSKDKMEVASIPVSLPSYQSQMTGAVQSCSGNECGRVKSETLPEHLLIAMKLKKQDVAVFSSWPVIANALESKQGTVYNSVGNFPVVDPITNQPDTVMQAINQKQTMRQHYEGNRVDEYTFAQALHYFEKYQPKFLWVSLVNADNEAHMNRLQKYRQTLLSYDDYLQQLFDALKKMKLEKNTMVIITTDHGRGDKNNWVTHGEKFPESKPTWAIVMNGKLLPVRQEGDVTFYSTLSVRPTVEAALLGG